MIIGIDASRANREKKTGTEWYSWHLIQELKKIAPPAWQVKLYTNAPLVGELAELPSNFQEVRLAWRLHYLWTQFRLWRELWVNPPAVFFVPAHTIPFLPIKKKIKVVATVHDVGFKHFPGLYKKIQVFYHDLTMKQIRRRADLIITDSEFSKREIVKFYRADWQKIRVVYLGYDHEKYNLAAAGRLTAEAASAGLEKGVAEIGAALKKYRMQKPYLFYVGRLERKKNIFNIIRGFTIAKKSYPELKLVLAGSGGNFYQGIKKILVETETQEEIILPGYVSEDDLPILIGQAEVFMFPTLYEGFGLPIIQAMACGTPVITSDMNPHREVAGDAAVFVSPFETKQIAADILELCLNQKVAGEMREKGLARAQEFSWAKTAQEVLKLLD